MNSLAQNKTKEIWHIFVQTSLIQALSLQKENIKKEKDFLEVFSKETMEEELDKLIKLLSIKLVT